MAWGAHENVMLRTGSHAPEATLCMTPFVCNARSTENIDQELSATGGRYRRMGEGQIRAAGVGRCSH